MNPFRHQNLEAIANYVRAVVTWKVNAKRDQDHGQPVKPFPECPWKIGDATDADGNVIPGEAGPLKNSKGEFVPVTEPYFTLRRDGRIDYVPLGENTVQASVEGIIQKEIARRVALYAD